MRWPVFNHCCTVREDSTSIPLLANRGSPRCWMSTREPRTPIPAVQTTPAPWASSFSFALNLGTNPCFRLVNYQDSPRLLYCRESRQFWLFSFHGQPAWLCFPHQFCGASHSPFTARSLWTSSGCPARKMDLTLGCHVFGWANVV